MAHSLTVYRKDAVHKYPTYHRHANISSPAKRAAVTEFSIKSRRRLLWVLRNTHVKLNVFITLTLPPGHCPDGETFAKWRNNFLTAMRKEFGVRSYLWFLEFQLNGTPHLHLYAKIGHLQPEKWRTLHGRIVKRWHTIANGAESGYDGFVCDVKRLKGRDAAAKYAYGYAMKREQKTAPEGWQHFGRWWGHSRDLKPAPHFVRQFATLLELFQYVMELDQKSYDHMQTVWHRWTHPTPDDIDRGWTPLPSSNYFDLGEYALRAGGC